MESRDWTADDDALLMKMRAQKIPYKEISSIMGRSIDALDSRRRILSLSQAKVREQMDRKNVQRKHNRLARFKNHTSDPNLVPDHVLIDRAARLCAPVTPNVIVLGDPPIGFSALDRKRQEVPA
jgi:hypothetical protein